MCGIAGYVGFDQQPTVALTAALDAIDHRGPDGRGRHVAEGITMGMTRLAVIDLEHGDQPMFNEDHTVAVVFNGEIYNYRELRHDLEGKGHRFKSAGDTEVLVHLYEELGLDLVRPLRGMFSFAIHDARLRRVVLARDRFGKKPLYLARTHKGLVFGSELKALTPIMKEVGSQLSVSDQAVADYLSLGVVPQPQTIYREVESLPAAHIGVFTEAELTVSCYWVPQFEPKCMQSEAQVRHEVRELINEAVQLRLRSDVPLGVFLSGGLDSSIVAYEAARAVGPSLQSYTIAMEGALDESPAAGRTAAMLGIANTVLPVKLDPLGGIEAVLDAYDQPFADSSAIPSLQVAAAASEHVTVVLNGDGGDELFGGYRRYVAARALHRVPDAGARILSPLASRISRSAGRRSASGLASRLLNGVNLDDSGRYLAWTTDMLRRDDKRRYWVGPPVTQTEDFVRELDVDTNSSLDRVMALDHRVNLVSDLLVKMDIACMASGIEARSPLLDHVLAEYAFRLPDTLKIRRSRTKYILRSAYADVLPREVITGAKRGFEIPLAGWLARDLRPVLMDTVGSQSAHVRDYVDGKLIDDLLAGTALPHRNLAYLQYALLVLELWLRRWDQ